MIRALAVSLVLAAIVAGCSQAGKIAPRTDGPVKLGSTSGTICLPATSAGLYTMGFDVIRNAGNQAVTIDRVRTVGGSGVTVTESYLIPVGRGGGTLVGVGAWPPVKPPSNWGSKTPAVGPDRLDPADSAVDGWNLVLRLSATQPAATYDHLALDYSLQGVHYEAANQVGAEIESPC